MAKGATHTPKQLCDAQERRRAKAEKKPLVVPGGSRVRRISTRYLVHLTDIASILVECSDNVEMTCRRAKEELGVSLIPATLSRWIERSPEFQSAAQSARVVAANRKQAQPEIRAPQSIADLQGLRQSMRDQYDDDTSPKTLKLVLDLDAAIRAEERHIEDLRERAARRSFAGFLKKLMAYLRERFPEQMPALAMPLRDAAKNLDRVIAGRELQGVEA